MPGLAARGPVPTAAAFLAAVLLWFSGACVKNTPPPASPPMPSIAPSRPPPPKGRAWVLRGGRVMTAAGVVYESGDVLVVGDRIVQVGAHVEPPADATVIDVRGKTVTPGIIDTHSHLGVYAAPHLTAHGDGNEAVAPNTAYARAEDGYWPLDPQVQRARAGGVTTMQILPGSANLIGGRSITVKTYPWVRSAEDARFSAAPAGLKMACGENPKRVYGDKTGPSTRMGNIAGFRDAFQKAVEYRHSWKRYREKLAKYREKLAKKASGKGKRKARKSGDKDDDPEPPDPPVVDQGLETLVGVLDGRVLVHNHCYRADEMSLMMDLARSFGFSIRSFHHAVEAYKIADRLAQNDTAASVWADWWGFKAEAYDGVRENAALLQAAGSRAIIHSDSAIGIQRLNQEAAKAMFAGRRAGIEVTEDQALRWITQNPAWALGIEDEVGGIEPGKHADLVVWDRNPLSVYAKAQQVYIEGRLVFDATRPQSQPGSDFELGTNPMALAGSTAIPTGKLRKTPSKVSAKASARPPAATTLPFDGRSTGSIFVVGGRAHVGDGTVIDDAVVEMKGSRIAFVGPRSGAKVPDGAAVIDASGKIVTVGLIAADSNITLVEIGAEESTRDDKRDGEDPVRAAYDAATAVHAESHLVQVTAIEGVTTVAVSPQGGLVAGQVAWADLVYGDHTTMVARPRIAVRANFGQTVGKSRAATLAKLREVFSDARFLTTRRGAFDRRQTRDLVAHRLDLEALGPVLGRTAPLVVSAHRAGDILALLAFAKEFRVRLVITGGTQAWKVADELAEAGVIVIVHPEANLPGSFERLGARLDNAALLAHAGVEVGIAVLGEAHNIRNVRQQAGIAIANGLDPATALTAVTRTIARAYGMDGDYGTLAAGKVANVVVWPSDPWELDGWPHAVIVRGKPIPMKSRQTLLRERYQDLGRFRKPPP